MKIFDPKFTGSIEFQSPISVGGLTGSLFGTASWATNVVNAGGLSGGQDKYITRWNGTNSITTSSIYEGANKNIAINTLEFDAVNPEALHVSGSNINVISGEANVNTYVQLNIVNNSNGAQASADIVATNNTGTELGNYVDLGINGSNFGGAVGAGNEAYLFNTGSNFLIGNTTRGANANLKLFAGNDGTIFPLVVTGSNVIATGSFTGSFTGNLGNLNQILSITGALTLTSSGAGTELFVIGDAVITGSLIVSGSGGYGVFSKGITLADLTNGFDVTGSYFVWRAPYPATVVGLWAIKSGSSNISVNARRSGSATNHAASNLTITANNLWSSAATTQDRNYSAGDSLEIIFSGSAVIESSVQVDFIKR